jgi:hypothetical protein
MLPRWTFRGRDRDHDHDRDRDRDRDLDLDHETEKTSFCLFFWDFFPIFAVYKQKAKVSALTFRFENNI